MVFHYRYRKSTPTHLSFGRLDVRQIDLHIDLELLRLQRLDQPVVSARVRQFRREFFLGDVIHFAHQIQRQTTDIDRSSWRVRYRWQRWWWWRRRRCCCRGCCCCWWWWCCSGLCNVVYNKYIYLFVFIKRTIMYVLYTDYFMCCGGDVTTFMVIGNVLNHRRRSLIMR